MASLVPPRQRLSVSARCRRNWRTGKGWWDSALSRKPPQARMFADMPRLAGGSIAAIALCPLRLAPRIPDVVVVEGPSEVLMWLLLADLSVHGGERRTGSTAVLQATCVDATVIPHLEQRLNFSLGSYGCREATDLTPGRNRAGVPRRVAGPAARRSGNGTDKGGSPFTSQTGSRVPG